MERIGRFPGKVKIELKSGGLKEMWRPFRRNCG